MKKLLKLVIRVGIPLAIIGVSLLGFRILQTQTEEETANIPEPRAWLVEVQKVNKETLAPQVVLYGRVSSSSHSHLTSILDAEVVEVNFSQGEVVDQGDVLIRLDSRTIETQILQLQADIARIQANIEAELDRNLTDQELLIHEQRLRELSSQSLQRFRVLKDRNIVSQADYDVAERTEQQAMQTVTARKAAIRGHSTRMKILHAELKRVEIALDKAESDLGDTKITAPYPGRITAVHVAVGNHVRNGSALIELYNYADTEIRALIPNRYLRHIRTAQINDQNINAVAEVDGHQLNLVFDRLDSIVDPGQGGVDGFFRLTENHLLLELGRSTSLTVSLTPIENSIAIPFQAVYGSNQVFKVIDDSLQSVSLERHGQIHRDGHAYVVATSDQLNNNELVAVTQLSNAIDGLKVIAAPID